MRKDNIMEIKATLNKPYTKQQRINFIISTAYTHGYEIRETEEALEAWGYTQEEIEEQQKQQRNIERQNKINTLYEMSIPEMLNNNKENIQVYKDVILGLVNAME